MSERVALGVGDALKATADWPTNRAQSLTSSCAISLCVSRSRRSPDANSSSAAYMMFEAIMELRSALSESGSFLSRKRSCRT